MSVEDRTGQRGGMVNSTEGEGKGGEYYKSRWFFLNEQDMETIPGRGCLISNSPRCDCILGGD